MLLYVLRIFLQRQSNQARDYMEKNAGNWLKLAGVSCADHFPSHHERSWCVSTTIVPRAGAGTQVVSFNRRK